MRGGPTAANGRYFPARSSDHRVENRVVMAGQDVNQHRDENDGQKNDRDDIRPQRDAL